MSPQACVYGYLVCMTVCVCVCVCVRVSPQACVYGYLVCMTVCVCVCVCVCACVPPSMCLWVPSMHDGVCVCVCVSPQACVYGYLVCMTVCVCVPYRVVTAIECVQTVHTTEPLYLLLRWHWYVRYKRLLGLHSLSVTV